MKIDPSLIVLFEILFHNVMNGDLKGLAKHHACLRRPTFPIRAKDKSMGLNVHGFACKN